MMDISSPVWTTLIVIITFLFGSYEIGYGIYAWRLNRFSFYITAGFLIGSPFLAMGIILLLHPRPGFQWWEGLVFLVWIVGVGWKAWRKRIARKEHPVAWAKWEEILAGKNSPRMNTDGTDEHR